MKENIIGSSISAQNAKELICKWQLEGQGKKNSGVS